MRLYSVLAVGLLMLMLVSGATAQQIRRTYVLFVPETYEGDLPLVVALHGAGGTGQHIADITGFNAIAEEEDFAVLYPDGFANNWNFGFGVRTQEGVVDIDDVGYLTALVEAMAEEYPIDLDRVFVTGFSNGATMAYFLACRAPEVFKGVAGVASAMPVAVADTCTENPISMLIIHGTLDPILDWNAVYSGEQKVSYSVTESLFFWGRHNGCDIENPVMETLPDTDTTDESTVRMVTLTDCEDETQVKLYGVTGGGHTWPGHVIQAPFELGMTNMDMDASQVIWDWFKQL